MTMLTDPKKFISYFSDRFGPPDFLVRAPSRINIIGEHIDYCGGTVLPFASELSMYFLIRKKDEGSACIESYNYQETYKPKLEDADVHWKRLVNHIFSSLSNKSDQDFTFDLSFYSDIPSGGGLSSSTALCCGIVSILNSAYGINLSKEEIIAISSAAEYGAGVKGGLMDQFAIVCSRKGQLLKLDCSNNNFRYLDFDFKRSKFFLLDTSVHHMLAKSEYNVRRQELLEGLSLLGSDASLKDALSSLSFKEIGAIRDDVLRKRILHIISEQERVLLAERAIAEGNMDKLGALLFDSHASLKENYEVSCEEADFLVDQLKKIPEVLGARIMGGGFGGHVLAMVPGETQDEFFDTLKLSYEKRFTNALVVRSIQSTDGLQSRKITRSD